MARGDIKISDEALELMWTLRHAVRRHFEDESCENLGKLQDAAAKLREYIHKLEQGEPINHKPKAPAWDRLAAAVKLGENTDAIRVKGAKTVDA